MSIRNGHLYGHSARVARAVMNAVCVGRISNNKIVISIPIRGGEIDIYKLKAANEIKRAQNIYEAESRHELPASTRNRFRNKTGEMTHD